MAPGYQVFTKCRIIKKHFYSAGYFIFVERVHKDCSITQLFFRT